MHIRFFAGVNDKEIIPECSQTSTASHYAWCLQKLIIGLDGLKDESARREVLYEFKANMKRSPGTKKMLAEVDDLFISLIESKPLPKNDYLINCLKGLPVDDSRAYLSYVYDAPRQQI